MAKKPIGFTEEGARRIVRAVRRVERGDDGGGGGDWYPYRGDDCEGVLCKTTSAWAKGASATLQIWAGQPGSETDTGATLVAYNRFAAIASGRWCTVLLHRHGHYYVIAAECA